MYLVVKRCIDLLFALSIIILFLPFGILLFIMIKIDSKGPIFFTQKRVGKNGVIFSLYKLRTMSHKERDPSEQVYVYNQEVTSLGRVLRRLKIDELPQLINVLIGDMSLVGPRPCLPNLVESFNHNGKKRLLINPGLTGLAQVNGNIHLTWEERWEYDAYYVDTVSFILDMKVILKTIYIVFAGEQKGKTP